MDLSCHCGRIKLQAENPPATLTSCNCSSCHRLGALWGYYAPSEVIVNADSTDLQAYSWSDKNLELMRCSHCGCQTHYVTTAKVAEAKVGVNFRMAERAAIRDIPIRYFDGAETWTFLAGPENEPPQ